MMDGVPPQLLDDHMKSFKKAVGDGKTTDPNFGLDKTSIAGAAGMLSCSRVYLNND